MQRTPGTPLNDPTSSPQVEDAATPEPADSPSAGSPSSTPAEPATVGAPSTTSNGGAAAAGGSNSAPEGADSSTNTSAADVAATGGEAGGGEDGSAATSSSRADVAGGGEAGKRSWKWTVVFGGVGLVVLFLDQLTKALALAHLTPGEPVNVIGSLLKFNLIRNSGAAFSLGAGYTPYISAVQIIVAIGVIYLSRKLGSVGWAIAFGLLFGGAVGNILDRIFREPSPFHGHVVDFLQTPHWAIFNVADMAVTSAAVLLVIQTLRGIKLDGTREQRK
ncbi:signal peptidase II [Kribbella sp. NPDC059898]|uniref:signal peptidase II n=1 Tax=Kribbella sp. NPDC059898 TaxID=3346995 RepID=UPI00365CEB70